MTMNRLSSTLHLDKGHGPTQVSKYFGGEIRHQDVGKHAVVTIGAESCSAANAKESVAFMLLKHVLGTGTNIKRGSLNGKLGKAVANIEGQKAVGGFNFAYQDTGLVGAMIMCEAPLVGNVTSQVLAALRGLNVSNEELSAAKKALLLEMSESHMNAEAVTETLATRAMLGVDALSNVVNTITTADLNVS